MTTILSTTAAEVQVQKLPENTKHVTYKIATGEISFYYWIQDMVAKYNFYDPNYVNEESIAPGFMHGYRGAYYPSGGSLHRVLEEAAKFNLKNIVFDCVGIARLSTRNSSFGNLVDTISFHGASFGLTDDGKSLQTTSYYSLPNTSGGQPCWGNRRDVGNDYGSHNLQWTSRGTIHGKINTFIKTTFNNDYVSLYSWLSTISRDKENTKNDSSTTLLLNDDSDAFLTISFKSHPVAYFRLMAAGFKPVDSTDLMLLPLKAGSVTHEETEYCGYFTQEDAIGKKWFVNDSGHLLGQVDD